MPTGNGRLPEAVAGWASEARRCWITAIGRTTAKDKKATPSALNDRTTAGWLERSRYTLTTEAIPPSTPPTTPRNSSTRGRPISSHSCHSSGSVSSNRRPFTRTCGTMSSGCPVSSRVADRSIRSINQKLPFFAAVRRGKAVNQNLRRLQQSRRRHFNVVSLHAGNRQWIAHDASFNERQLVRRERPFFLPKTFFADLPKRVDKRAGQRLYFSPVPPRRDSLFRKGARPC